MAILEDLLRRFTIRLRMIGAILMVLALLAAVGGAGLFGMFRIQAQSTDFFTHSVSESANLQDLTHAMGNIRRFEKDMMLSYDQAAEVARYKGEWEKSLARAQAAAESMLQGEEDEDNKLARDMVQRLKAYKGQMGNIVRQIEAGAYDNASVANKLAGKAKDEIRAAEKLLAELQAELTAEATAERESLDRNVKSTLALFAALVVVAVVVVVPLTLLNSRSIVQPIDQARRIAHAIAQGDLTHRIEARGADEAAELLRGLEAMQLSLQTLVGNIRSTTDSISTASAQIASGNQDLSGRTEQTAGSLQQTASSMEQLTGTVRQTADSARTANQLAASAAEAAQRGGSVVQQVVANMEDINTSSRKIADIIGTIDGIAFQTNILALNAAVEAARAGEQGRGFAVVAGEVRSLAQRSATAAREIKSLIGASVEKVESGSRLVQDAGTTMTEIVSGVQRVTDIIGEITAAASEQSNELGQVNGAVVQLDQMTQQNAALVEESAAAAESLREQAEKLAALVATFRLRDGVAAAPPPYAPLRRTPAPAPRPAVRPAAAPAPRVTAPAAPRVSAAPAPAPRPAALPPAKSPAAAAPNDGDWETF